mmetsp:Transcript_6386/g.17821  ORF Transcript_6386/g.17821 Transcript_6386/m.17821 type:complete len:211 (+) Transcript_6386:4123-4755(+)
MRDRGRVEGGFRHIGLTSLSRSGTAIVGWLHIRVDCHGLNCLPSLLLLTVLHTSRGIGFSVGIHLAVRLMVHMSNDGLCSESKSLLGRRVGTALLVMILLRRRGLRSRGRMWFRVVRRRAVWRWCSLTRWGQRVFAIIALLLLSPEGFDSIDLQMRRLGLVMHTRVLRWRSRVLLLSHSISLLLVVGRSGLLLHHRRCTVRIGGLWMHQW